MKQIIKINDYYEYEVNTTIERTVGQIVDNIAIVEVKLYGRERKTGGGTTTRSLINTFKKEVKRPNILQFLLGLSWRDQIESTQDKLRIKAIRQAAELWHSEVLPKEIRKLIDRNQ